VVVDKATGAYSGSVSQTGKSFTQFGTCTGIDRERLNRAANVKVG